MVPNVWIILFLTLTYCGHANSQAVYLEYYNSHVIGGHHHGTAFSIVECVRACQASITCFAVDYDGQGHSCWFHDVTGICSRPMQRLGATHIKLSQCLNPSYSYPPDHGQIPVSYKDRHVIGGIFIPGLSSVYLCIKSCTGSCTAVDFDSADNSCWHHVTTAACAAPLAIRAGSSHYRMPSCNAGFVASHFQSTNAIVPYVGQISSVNISPVPPISPPTPPLAPSLQPIKSPANLPITCGSPAFPPITGRIVGGDISKPHSWPWQVALRNKKSRSVRCAGSLIAPQLVLTTAHCVDEDLIGSNWLVYSGGYDLLKYENSRTTHTVESVTLHERFDINTFDNDVALLKLSSPVVWNEYKSPVCLPPPGFELAPETKCVITGWGVSENGIRPLKQASVPIIDMSTCRRKDWLGSEFVLTQRMMCAGYAYGGVDTCQGDSGGPMVCYINNRWVQMGITSFGRGCGLPKKPGVYSKVSHFVDWIQAKARML